MRNLSVPWRNDVLVGVSALSCDCVNDMAYTQGQESPCFWKESAAWGMHVRLQVNLKTTALYRSCVNKTTTNCST